MAESSWWPGPTLDARAPVMVARCEACGCRLDDGKVNDRLRHLLRALRPLIPRPSPVRPLSDGRSVVRLIRDGALLDVGGWTYGKPIARVLCDVASRGMLALADAGHPPEVVASLQLHAYKAPPPTRQE